MINHQSKTVKDCVKCGVCKAFCPTYIETSLESMSSRGRTAIINSLSNKQIHPSEDSSEKIFSCMLCGSCENACPMEIKIIDAVYENRMFLKRYYQQNKISIFMLKNIFKNTSKVFNFLFPLRDILHLFPTMRLNLLKTFKSLNISISDNKLIDKTMIFKSQKPKGRVALFVGCSTNYIYPNIGKSAIKILTLLNYDVILSKNEVCCGAPLRSLGFKEDARGLAERNLEFFKNLKAEYIIGLCPTCIHFIKNEYPKLTNDCLKNTVEISQFLYSNHRFREILEKSTHSDYSEFRSSNPILYHQPCYSYNHLKIKTEPQEILQLCGYNLIETTRQCCGFAGLFSVLYPELSEKIFYKNIKIYEKTDTIVTSCPNCIMRFKSKLKNKSVKHIVEIIQEILLPN